MCGIIGYTGKNKAVPYLLYGLSKLQYRGYDSSGIALLKEREIKAIKAKGTVRSLERRFDLEKHKDTTGIGHTRWATHGKPSDTNAHPHLSQTGLFAVVHNGIIENAQELRDKLQKDGFVFKSETDTEVICHLLEQNYFKNSLTALTKTLSQLQGSFALGIICKEEKDKILAVRKESPLIVANGEDGLFLASDSAAIVKYTNTVYTLNDGEIAVLSGDKISFYDINGVKIQKTEETLNQSAEETEKDGFDHFMQKEINEQPQCIKDTLQSLIKEGEIYFPHIKLKKSELAAVSDVHFVACGSAYHVGLTGQYLVKETANIPAFAHIASEFRYITPCLTENSLVIIISQSGETADTLAALRLSKETGAKIISVVNVKGSTIDKESENIIYTKAGTEIAVATTKAYSTQLASVYLLALYLANIKHIIKDDALSALIAELSELPKKVSLILENDRRLRSLSYIFSRTRHIFFLGRHLDYPTACEGALKMKEITYIPSEAYPSGELKHGTISLIERGTLVIAICANDKIFKKALSNIKEVKARGGFVIAITAEKHRNHIPDADEVITVPDFREEFLPSLTVIPLQLLSYYTAKEKGLDIDKPRNLAKSVTVE